MKKNTIYLNIAMGNEMKHHLLFKFGIIVALAANVAFTNSAIAQDDPKVPTYIKKCDGGNTMACSLLGAMYRAGGDVTLDMSKSVMFYSKACDGGDSDGCYNSGIIYRDGEGVAKDIPAAIRYLNTACDGRDASACTVLGQMYWLGKDAIVDKAKAEVYFNKTLAINPDDFLVRDYLEQLKQP